MWLGNLIDQGHKMVDSAIKQVAIARNSIKNHITPP